MEKEELKYWLAWNRVKEIGPIRFAKLYQYFSSLKEAWNYDMKNSDMMNLLHIRKETMAKIEQEKRQIDPEEEWISLQKKNIKVITIKEEGYPVLLKNIYSPPPLIYYQGNFVNIIKEAKGLAIVGSRKATYYGRKVARDMAGEIAKSGYIVISGLARGIDTNAHMGALEVEGLTIAVLGCGLDRIYPSENTNLARRIAEKGAIITEFPLFTKPERGNFPRRNRIISGLSMGTIVVEATKKSGALITADYALEQGREVFAVPGSIHSFFSIGCHNLIKQGAKLVNNCQDIMEEFVQENDFFLKLEGKKSNNQENGIIVELNNYEQKLLKYISIEPLHIDEIIELAAIPFSKANEALLSLELKNIIREIEGKRFIRI